MNKISASIIIISYNTKKILKDCLNSLISLNKKYEIVVVDNNSVDGSREMIERNFPKVKLIKNTKNLGFGKANNIGVKNSKGNFIIFLNSDTKIIDKNFVEKMIKILKKKKVGIVGCQLISKDGKKQKYASKITPLKNFYYYGNKIKEVDWVSGACVGIRRDLFSKLHGFDERFFLFYEETDLCFRVKKIGLKIITQPSIKIIHYGGKSGENLYSSFTSYHWYRSRMLFFMKHHLFVLLMFRMIKDLIESVRFKKYNILFKAYKDAIRIFLR